MLPVVLPLVSACPVDAPLLPPPTQLASISLCGLKVTFRQQTGRGSAGCFQEHEWRGRSTQSAVRSMVGWTGSPPPASLRWRPMLPLVLLDLAWLEVPLLGAAAVAAPFKPFWSRWRPAK